MRYRVRYSEEEISRCTWVVGGRRGTFLTYYSKDALVQGSSQGRGGSARPM